MDFLKVVDHVDFDLERVLTGFRQYQILESSSEIKVRRGLTEVKFLKRLDGLVHPDIRIFEEGRLFLLREPLSAPPTGQSSSSSTPEQPLPKASQTSHSQKKRRKTAHLAPGPPLGQGLRYWSGATGSAAAPQPFSAWGPSPPKFPPPRRTPQKPLKTKPKAMLCDVGDESFESATAAVLPKPPRAKSSEASQAARMRQVSNVLRSLAVLIAPRPSTAEQPILSLTMES